MTVVSEGPLCLKIRLSKLELKKYFVSYNKIHFGDPKVKKTILFLFEAAIASAEFETEGKRTIEIFPTALGGCILKFTSEPFENLCNNTRCKNRINAKSKSTSYIFAFNDFDTIVRLIKSLRTNSETLNYPCSLFSFGNRYYLKIIIPIFDVKTSMLMSEFALYSTKGCTSESLLEEYAVRLISNNALKEINSTFLK